MNHAYFLGAGPGDPDLLTLKAARLLRKCSTVFAFPPYGETFSSLLAGKTVLDPFEFYFRELLDRVERELEIGHVGFLDPGDLTFFSPFQPLIDALGERAVVVPGVGTVNAAAAFLKRTLHLTGTSSRVVIASPRLLGEQAGAPALEELAAPGVTLVLYMNNLPLSEIASRLREGYGKNVAVAIFHRLSLPGERVLSGTLEDIVAKSGGEDFFSPGAGGKEPSLTLVVVGECLSSYGDPDGWDRRCRRLDSETNGTSSRVTRENYGQHP
jgi:precorrin-4/cobalt-precorrin-4 C11-methyltransferase